MKSPIRPKTPNIHVKLPSWARGTLMVQNSTTPNRVVPRPSFRHPPTINIQGKKKK